MKLNIKKTLIILKTENTLFGNLMPLVYKKAWLQFPKT